MYIYITHYLHLCNNLFSRTSLLIMARLFLLNVLIIIYLYFMSTLLHGRIRPGRVQCAWHFQIFDLFSQNYTEFFIYYYVFIALGLQYIFPPY